MTENAQIEFHYPFEDVSARMTPLHNAQAKLEDELVSYHEVKENQILLVRKADESWPRNSEGRFLDDQYKARRNVIAVIDDDKNLIYKSTLPGMAVYTLNGLEVMEDLVIDGNITPTTGDISYSGNIMIKGDVTYGRSITCGGELVILKNVDDNVTLNCDGPLKINGGCCGEGTIINGKKSITLGYLEYSKIFCEKDITIRVHSYEARIVCMGRLSIQGQKVINKQRGTLFGGYTCSFGQLSSKSIGGEGIVTEIYVGIDFKIKENFDKLTIAKDQLDKKLLVSQRYLSQFIRPDKVQEDLVKLNNDSKIIVRDTLKEIRDLRRSIQQIEERIPLLEQKMYNRDPHENLVTVQEFIAPKVQLQIRQCQELLEDKYSGYTRIKYQKGEFNFF